MIVRIINEGQWVVDDDTLNSLNQLDDAVEDAVDAGDATRLRQALTRLYDRVRTAGTVVPDDTLVDSDLILPDADSTIADVRDWLADSGSEDGLIPGR